MPYSSISELPEAIRGKYTSKQLRAFRSAFNSALKQGRKEKQAFQIAHRAAQGAGERDAVDNAKAGKRQKSAEELAREAGERVARRPPPETASVSTPVQPGTGLGLERVRAFVTEVNDKTIITARAELPKVDELEKAWTVNPHFLWLQGKFVGAEKANRNGALWTTGDLEMGEPTVKHGPLNWLHEDHKIVGAIAEAKLVHPFVEGAAEGVAPPADPYIAAASVVWQFLWPLETQVIEQAAEAERLWYSMECVSREIACVDHECGSWGYMDVMRQKAEVCDHVRLKEGRRRFVDPVFTGGAVIVPPVRPGWPDAHASLMKQAAVHSEKAFEQAGQPEIEASEWERLMANVLAFAGAEG